MRLRYLPAARADILSILRWSADRFGRPAAAKYQRLIGVALSEIAANPGLDGSYQLRGLQAGIRLFHLKHCRDRAAMDGQRVKKPRHFIAYHLAGPDVIIVRILHERMEVGRHLGGSTEPEGGT